MSHRFVTVRRGSPAARSGQIQPGDQLDAVENRPTGGLQHRDLAQILRRAGNTLRLSVTPRRYSSSQTEAADLDIDSRLIKGSRGRSKDQFYSVDLDRGPTGFGFSLRGGSEYNMGLYVLGLMEGGPAQRSNKIQVSDQLVDINGDSTVGMTHSQAVEQIRRGGHRIHLVLKKGNGYVPDYGPEEGVLSSSSSSHTEERHLISMATSSSIRQRGGAGGEGGGEKRRTRREGESRKRTGGRLGPSDLDLDLVEEEAQEEERRREEEEEEEEERRRKEENEERRKREEERRRGEEEKERRRKREDERRREEKERRRKEEKEEKRKREEERRREEESAAEEQRGWTEEEERRRRKEERRREKEERGRNQTVRQKKRDDQQEQGRRSRSLPKNRASYWDTTLPEEGVASGGGANRGEVQEKRSTRSAKHSGSSGAVFSFLMPTDDDKRQRQSDSESAASFSDVSQSTASITTSWREESHWRRDESLWQQGHAPGPWLKPSPQKLTHALTGSRPSGRALMGGLSL